MYVQNSSRYPLSADGNARSHDPLVFWFDLLEPYAGSKWTNRLYWCPATRLKAEERSVLILDNAGHAFKRGEPQSGNADINVVTVQGDYGYNGQGTAFGSLSAEQPPLGLGFEGQPAR